MLHPAPEGEIAHSGYAGHPGDRRSVGSSTAGVPGVVSCVSPSDRHSKRSEAHVTLDPQFLKPEPGGYEVHPALSSTSSQDERFHRGSSKELQRATSKTSKTSRTSRTSRTSVPSSRPSVVRIASDFIQRHKVDPLACTVMVSGAIVAACAGMTNAVAFLALGAFVSHVTGTLSKVGMHTEAGALSDAGDSLLLVVCFALGSVVCGCLITRSTVSFGYALYGLALMGNASLLVLAMLTAEHKAAPYLLAAACGLQNGMATSYSGAVIRTTHVTGLCTDIGLIIGRNSLAFLRKHFWHREDNEDHTADCRKLFLLFLLGTSFLGGVFLGSVLHASAGLNALILPACLSGTSGAAYTTYRTCWLHQPLTGCTDPEEGMDDGAIDRHAVRTSSRHSCASMEEGTEGRAIARHGAKTSSKHSNASIEDGIEVLRKLEDGSLEPSPASAAPHRGVLSPRRVSKTLADELRLEDVTPPQETEGKAESKSDPFPPPPIDTPRTPNEKVSVERLVAFLDALEPSLARLLPSPVPGTPDIQAEVMDTHGRLRSLLAELGASPSSESRGRLLH